MLYWVWDHRVWHHQTDNHLCLFCLPALFYRHYNLFFKARLTEDCCLWCFSIKKLNVRICRQTDKKMAHLPCLKSPHHNTSSLCEFVDFTINIHSFYPAYHNLFNQPLLLLKGWLDVMFLADLPALFVFMNICVCESEWVAGDWSNLGNRWCLILLLYKFFDVTHIENCRVGANI